MFSTGDVGPLLPHGCLVIEGRIGDDTQIKIGGVRIDLRDIKQTIEQASRGIISKAVAVVPTMLTSSAVKPAFDSKFILDYVVFNTEFLKYQSHEGPTEAIFRGRAYLARLLADLPLRRTVCPSMLIPLEKTPLTISGKMDRRALAAKPVDRVSSFATRQEIDEIKSLTDMELSYNVDGQS
jgi:hybrid polyketide synthase/nonribosomal peptide synthetase ACE1